MSGLLKLLGLSEEHVLMLEDCAELQSISVGVMVANIVREWLELQTWREEVAASAVAEESDE